MMALEPITREETYLAAAAGQNVETPEPITRKEMFLDAIAKSGGGGGAKHWNDIEGKPFGEELKSVELENDGREYFADSPFGEFAIGQTYTVVFDGVTYTDLAVFEDSGMLIIGSPMSAMSEDLPFTIATVQTFIMAMVLDSNNSHTIIVQGKGYKTIDPKFLPISSLKLLRAKLIQKIELVVGETTYSDVNYMFRSNGYVGQFTQITYDGWMKVIPISEWSLPPSGDGLWCAVAGNNGFGHLIAKFDGEDDNSLLTEVTFEKQTS